MAEKKFVKGPLLPEPQEVFDQIQHNWSTNISIDGPNVRTDTGYYKMQDAPAEARENPAIVVRDGYAHIRAVFIMKKNISQEEWKEVALEAMSRPECALNGGTGNFGIKAETINRIYKGLSYVSEYPFPTLKPEFCLEEMYEAVQFTCKGTGPCQVGRPNVAGTPGALCKAGQKISYAICAAMHCYCSRVEEFSPMVAEMEKILPTRLQWQLMQKYDAEARGEKPVDAGEVLKKKRSEAAKKGWEARRLKEEAAKKVEAPMAVDVHLEAQVP